MNNTKELLEDFLTYLADEGVEFNLGYHDHAADYIKKKELKSDLLNPVSKCSCFRPLGKTRDGIHCYDCNAKLR